MSIKTTTTVACCLLLATATLAFAGEAQTVSPGTTDRFAEVAGRCPTFSWAEIPGAGSYELVVYRVPAEKVGQGPAAIDLAEDNEALFERLPGGATGWTPHLDSCLDPGAAYAWFLRGLTDDERTISGAGWSQPRFFTVSLQPTMAEVEEALEVLRRYSSGSEFRDDGAHAAPVPRSTAPTVPRIGSSVGQKHVTTTATSSVKGEMLDPSGEAYGVIGISNSSNGAGVGAGNTGNGPDLVLDGSEDGNDPDAIFTQAGIDRPSSTADTWFFLLNADDNHVLNLHVEGGIQFGAEGTDGGLFYRDPANGDLRLQVNSSKMKIDIGGGTRITIDDTGAVTIDGTTVTVSADNLNLTGRSQLTLGAPNIDINATADLELGGAGVGIAATALLDLDGATVDIAGAGATNITGATVTIN